MARAATGWGAGIRRVVVDAPEPWMDPPADKLALHFMHQDQVAELPPGGVVLGRADHCPAALMRVGESMVGLQAHPEFTPAYTDVLLADRVARIGEDEVVAARAGLSQPTDEATVARWIGRVLSAAPRLVTDPTDGDTIGGHPRVDRGRPGPGAEAVGRGAAHDPCVDAG